MGDGENMNLDLILECSDRLRNVKYTLGLCSHRPFMSHPGAVPDFVGLAIYM